MAENIQTITDTTIIPEDSRERFMVFDLPDGHDWFGNGIRLAGVSALTRGYLVRREPCPHHVAIYCLEGRAEWSDGEQEGKLRPGEWLFIPARRLQYYRADDAYGMIWFHLAPEAPRWNFLRESGTRHRQARHLEEARHLAETILLESRRFPAPETETARGLCRILCLYLERELENGSENNVQKRRIGRVFDRVARDPAHPWTIAELARQARMSPSHFFAMTKTHYRQTPQRLVRSLRLRAAGSYLLGQTRTLDRIAELVGFGSGFALSRAFKQEYGLSPRAWLAAGRK